MSTMRTDQIYSSVERAVMWGEPEEQAFETMRANGIIGEEARALYRHAKKERTRILREGCITNIVKGIAAILLSWGLVFAIGFFFGVIFRIMFIGAILASLWGFWISTNGLLTYIAAPYKKGSIHDEVL